METQKTLKRRSNFGKEWGWKNQLTLFQTILQSYSHQVSMKLTQKQKYGPMEQDRKSRDKSHTYSHLIFEKGGETIQWKKR